jgi:hypothetical protein
MTIHVQKAGQKAVAAVAAKGSKALAYPRAVTVAEAPFIKPATESTKTTMMPWNQWFQRWVQQTFGEERYQKMRSTFWFMPVRTCCVEGVLFS